MQKTAVIEPLKKYIGQDVMGGKDIGLDETTPLLEWGVINSLEIVRLLQFIRKQFDLDIPMEKLIPDHFTDISSIADLVMGQAAL
jgi:acyl carrier protein